MTSDVVFVNPRTWRQIMRDEANLLGWSRAKMRAELKARGLDHLDPWKVPLPVLNEGVESFFGLHREWPTHPSSFRSAKKVLDSPGILGHKRLSGDAAEGHLEKKLHGED